MSFVVFMAVVFAFGVGDSPARPVDELCQPLSQPKRMPTVGQLLDSASLLTRLQSFDSSSSAELVISVDASASQSGYLVDAPPPSARQDSVLEYVLASLRQSPKGAPPRFRVHVQFGRARSVSVHPSILCRPETVGGPMQMAPVVGKVIFRSSGGPPQAASPPRQVSAKLRINVEGRVVDVDLGSGSGYDEIDQSIRTTMESQRFTPATLDGKPVEVWLRGTKTELAR